MNVIKKNDKIAISLRDGKGFWGPTILIRDRFSYIATQWCEAGMAVTWIHGEFPVNDDFLNFVQRNFLKRYGKELLLIRSSVPLPGFKFSDGSFERHLEPVGKQISLEIKCETEIAAGTIAEAEVEKNILRASPGRRGRKVRHLGQVALFDRDRQQEAEKGDPESPLRNIGVFKARKDRPGEVL